MKDNYQQIAKLLRYYSIKITSDAGSGHTTSSLSAADLMAVFISKVYRFDIKNPDNPGNDRLIFSKGHASPLFYALYTVAGAISEKELSGYRTFGSDLEGHPTPRFTFTEAATGSLGQGLSIGVGEALALRANSKFQIPNSKNNKNSPQSRVFVLLGDGEMAEGSTWEAIQIAAHYKLDNLVGILDVNRLGQSGETMLGHDVYTYKKRVESFGWETIVIDGHDFREIKKAFEKVDKILDKPLMIIAKTKKGKGVSFLEDESGWHGKPPAKEQALTAIREQGRVDIKLRVKLRKPNLQGQPLQGQGLPFKKKIFSLSYKKGEMIATRKAYGTGLARLGEIYPEIVALDGDVKNSTYSEIFMEKFPQRFFEMFIAEQNMVGAAVGFSKRGFRPFVSTFAAFFTRAYDQIRMAALSGANIKFCGSHAGVSIGEDGPSQMGLEDLSMFRAIHGSIVVYPSDAVSTEKLLGEMIKRGGISYMRTSRPTTPVIYDNSEEFEIGGSKVHRIKIQNPKSKIVIIAAGITLFEALKAQGELAKKGIEAIVVDLYSIKPIDTKTLTDLARAALANGNVASFITVEDHWFEGGLGDAVLNVFSASPKVRVHKLAVSKMPRSGKPAELLSFEQIDSKAIVEKVKSLI